MPPRPMRSSCVASWTAPTLRRSRPSANCWNGVVVGAPRAPSALGPTERWSGRSCPHHSRTRRGRPLPDRRVWWRVVQGVGGVLLVALAVRSLSRNWNDLRSQSIDWHVDPVWIGLSLVITWGAYAALIEAWRRV